MAKLSHLVNYLANNSYVILFGAWVLELGINLPGSQGQFGEQRLDAVTYVILLPFAYTIVAVLQILRVVVRRLIPLSLLSRMTRRHCCLPLAVGYLSRNPAS